MTQIHKESDDQVAFSEHSPITLADILRVFPEPSDADQFRQALNDIYTERQRASVHPEALGGRRGLRCTIETEEEYWQNADQAHEDRIQALKLAELLANPEDLYRVEYREAQPDYID
jgi:hypothetical protein